MLQHSCLCSCYACCVEIIDKTIIDILECGDVMRNCIECSAFNHCTACDGDLVVNVTGDGCTGKKYLQKYKGVFTIIDINAFAFSIATRY